MSTAPTTPLGPPWTLAKLLAWTREHFARKGVDQPRLAAEILLAHALGCPKIQLYTQFETEPPAAVLDRFRELVRRAAAREPIAYLVGQREFFSLAFEVGPGVLIPRPETEHVVELAADLLGVRRPGKTEPPAEGEPAAPPATPPADATIWDFGTGSGCIAITLAVLARKAARPLRVVASDVSAAALEIAARNAQKHGVADAIRFVQADGLALPPDAVPAGGFDLLAANPPYIAEPLRPTLAPELAYEPQGALFAGPDGLVCYRVLAGAGRLLKPQAPAVLEIGAEQGPAVSDVFAAASWSAGPTRHDLAGLLRVLTFRPPA